MKIENDLNELLGHKGKMLGSKTFGPAMAQYNANLCVNGKIVWYGDINLDPKNIFALHLLSIKHCKLIEIFNEMSLRDFGRDDLKKTAKKNYKDKIGLIWSSDSIFKIYGEDYFTFKKEAEDRKEKLIKYYQIEYGTIAPNGEEWNLRNKLLYKNPLYRTYKYLHFKFEMYIQYPWFLSEARAKDNFHKLYSFYRFNEFLQAVAREFKYRWFPNKEFK